MCSLSNWREHSKSLSKLTRIQQKNEQKQRMILNTCISCIQKYLPNSRSRQRLCTVSKQISTIEVNIPRPSPETHGGAPTVHLGKEKYGRWEDTGVDDQINACLVILYVMKYHEDEEIPSDLLLCIYVHMTCREGADFLL